MADATPPPHAEAMEHSPAHPGNAEAIEHPPAHPGEQHSETAPGAGVTPPPAAVPGPSHDHEAAQKAVSEMEKKIEVKTLTVRQYLEATVVPLLLQGLQNLVLERPTNPVEYLAAFLFKNSAQKPDPHTEVKKEGQSKEAESASTAPDAKVATGHAEVKESNSAPSETSHHEPPPA
ncbi:hypothetical protein O6H91_16G073800 [Diphasiastrum complanatum]|uniref:Uncharacterized protein n=1 Tax=Diphasiastrum complanatum TaxID=34168 RepID=A0ACC2BEG0_DIPCM|nr:hypothetical protein O6H91_16G073800 [Diphasiastrum complanatum]